MCLLPAGARAQERLTFQDGTAEDFLHAQAAHTNTEYSGTPGVLQVRQWSPDERAAYPDLTGNTLRMRVRLLRGEQAELRTIMSVAPGAPAVLGGPPHGDGVLVIILWANPNPAPAPGR